MNNKEQHIRDLLRRWTTGEITAREEAELLAAAQEDPFLQEALAAYQGQTDQDHAAALARIRRETSQHLPITRSIGRWTAIAASMLLLVTAGWWALRQQPSLDMASVAMEKQTEEHPAPSSDDALAAESPSFTEKVDKNANESIAQSTPAEERNELVQGAPSMNKESVSPTTPPANYKAEPLPNSMATKDSGVSREEENAADLRTPSIDAETAFSQTRAAKADDLVSTPPPPAPTASPTYPTQNQAYSRRLDDPTRISNSGTPVPATGYRIIEGYVTDAEGYPLIGASIVTPGSANGTVTDLDGFYRITVSNQVKTLSVSYTGFESTQVNIVDQDKVDVALAEGSMALDEVVVTGLSAKKRLQADASSGTTQPAGGFTSLRDYLASNTPANTPRARIKVRFWVQADGRLTDFTILKSTNVGQNSLAIQLLQQGPKWEITEGNAPVETVYVVRF